MDGVSDELLVLAALQMKGIQRRVFIAEVCSRLCAGNTRQAERRFGWGRDTIAKGIEEQKRIQTGKPLKKTEHTDAIFENVQAVRAESEADPQTLEISIDTKTKVKLGEYDQGGTNTD